MSVRELESVMRILGHRPGHASPLPKGRRMTESAVNYGGVKRDRRVGRRQCSGRLMEGAESQSLEKPSSTPGLGNGSQILTENADSHLHRGFYLEEKSIDPFKPDSVVFFLLHQCTIFIVPASCQRCQRSSCPAGNQRRRSSGT